MRGIKSFIHSSKKDRTRNSDAEKLDELQIHLINLGWRVKREPIIRNDNFSTRNNIRNPDLEITRGIFGSLLELDGKLHGSLEAQTEKTINRNADYEVGHYNYIILSEEDAKFFKLDICDLAAYMVLHEYSKHIANLNGGLRSVD